MKKRPLILAAVLLPMMAGCSKSDIVLPFDDDPDAVKLFLSVDSGLREGNIPVRSNPQEDGAASAVFTKNDKVSLSNGKETAVYVYDGSSWKPEDDAKFLKWENADASGKVGFTAFYPADGVNEYSGNEPKFRILQDQSDAEKIAASDFMCVRESKFIPDNRELSLKLARKTNKIVVNIKEFKNPGNGGKLRNFKINAISVASHGLSFPYDQSEGIRYITPFTSGDGKEGTSYTALVQPFAVALEGEVFVKLTVGYEVSYGSSYSPESRDLQLKGIPAMNKDGGYSYTYNLTVGKDDVRIGSLKVTEWGEGASIPGDGDFVSKGISFAAGTFTKDDLLQVIGRNEPIQVTGDLSDSDLNIMREVLLDESHYPVDLSMPEETVIGQTFKDCKALRSIDLPKVNEQLQEAFSGCSNLESFNLPSVCHIGHRVFQGCSALKKAELPELKVINVNLTTDGDGHNGIGGEDLFKGCLNLKEVNIPNCWCFYTYNKSMFDGCSALSKVYLPSAKYVEINIFNGVDKGKIDLTVSDDEGFAWLEKDSYKRHKFDEVNLGFKSITRE